MPVVTIPISGIIARWQIEDVETNVTPVALKKSLDEAGGQDVLITINSPGGSVWEGLEMFSLIKNYPGNVETRVVSLAASMGSILALAGNKKSIENTALYYIHNAQGWGQGDYRALFKEAEFLKDVSELLAGLYDEYTTLTFDEAREWMDAESQFFGNDLAELGFEVVESGEVNASMSRINAKKRFADVKNKLSEDDFLNDLQKVAASISTGKIFDIKFDKKQLDNNNIMSHRNTNELNLKNKLENPAAGGENHKQEDVIMTLEELKAQHPDLYNQIFQAGVDHAYENVMSHMEWLEVDTAKVKAAIENRETFSMKHMSAYGKAAQNIKDLNDRTDDEQDTGTQSAGQNSDENISSFEKGMTGATDLMLDDEEV